MLSKNDFEMGLQQDLQEAHTSFKPPAAFGGNIVPVVNAGKGNLFGPPQNLGFQGNIGNFGGPTGATSGEVAGKSKRDLLWEQKRKQKMDIINPLPAPANKNYGGFNDNMSVFSDQMKPKPPISMMNPNEGFQKAVSFEQPVQIIMDVAPTAPAESFKIPNQDRKSPRIEPPMSNQPMNIPPPVQMGKREVFQPNGGNSIWDQVQQQSLPQQVQFSLPVQSNENYQFQAGTRPQGPPSEISASAGGYFQNQQQAMLMQPPQMTFDDPPRINSVQTQPPPLYQQQPVPQYMPSNQPFSMEQALPSQYNNGGGPQAYPQQYQMPQNSMLPTSIPSGYGGYQSNPPPPSQMQQQQQQQQVQMNPMGNEDKQKKQRDYLMQIQNEIKEKEEKKRREKEDKLRREREELKQQLEYNPFGKGGAGAPLRDNQGNIVVSRKPGDTPQQQHQMPMRNQSMHQLAGPSSQDYFNGPSQQQMMGNNNQYMMAQKQMDYDQPIVPMNDFNLKSNMPYSSHQSMDPQFQQPPQTQAAAAAGLGIGAFGDIDKIRKENQKQELQNELKKQMEEQKKRKEEQARKIKEEEMREEERIRKERIKIEEEFKMEEMKKKSKVVEFQQANANLAQQKKVGFDKEEASNFVVEKPKKSQRENLFGNGPSAPQPMEIQAQFEGFGQGGPQAFQGGGFQIQPQFAPPQLPIHQNDFNNPPPYFNPSMAANGAAGPSSSNISETRIIKDISSELKHNFREELDKLRQEMNSQQRAFRDQLERLKIEATRSNSDKNEALAEIEKVKAEIKAQRDAERMQDKKLYEALDKYNPAQAQSSKNVLATYDRAGSFPMKSDLVSVNPYGLPQQLPAQQPMNNSFYKSKRGGSRQDDRKKEINNYEKMFFNKAGGEEFGSKPGSSMSKPPLPSERAGGGFNFENIQYPAPQIQYSSAQGGQTIQNRQLPVKPSRQMRESFNGTLMGESELLPLDPNHRSFAVREQPPNPQVAKSNFNPVYDDNNNQPLQNNAYLDQLNRMGAGDVKLETESAIDTMDFVNKIVNGGGGRGGVSSEIRKGSSELPSKSNIRPSSNRRKEERFADRLDAGFDFNFPAIPAYEGIQNLENFKTNGGASMKDLSKPPVPNGFSYLPKPDIFSRGGIYQASPGERTNTSIGSLNSMNLDNLNKRNEDRMAKIGAAFDQLDLTNRSLLTNNHYSPDIHKENMNRQPNNSSNNGGGGLYQQSDELKKVDSLLFDLLRSNEPPPQSSGVGNGGPLRRLPSGKAVIPHMNQANNYGQIQKMRDSRDNFMAPKMGQIYEDGGEDYEGTYKRPYQQPLITSSANRLDSLLDTTNLALP